MRFKFPFIPETRPASAYGDQYGYDRRPSPFSGCGPRIIIALVIAGFALFQYLSTPTEMNHFTGRKQHLNLNPAQEIQMGMASAPGMAKEFGGLSPDMQATSLVKKVGKKIITSTDAGATPYRFDFHLLADDQTVNAFALPGGQIFITEALLRLLGSEDELAGVLGHEVGHVVGRHSSEQIAKSNLFGGLTQALIVGASGGNNGYDTASMAQWANKLINLKYGRDDETEADKLGVRFLIQCGYQPEGMLRVMDVLKKASAGSHQPEIMSSHPDPGNRAEIIKDEIARLRSGGA